MIAVWLGDTTFFDDNDIVLVPGCAYWLSVWSMVDNVIVVGIYSESQDGFATRVYSSGMDMLNDWRIRSPRVRDMAAVKSNISE